MPNILTRSIVSPIAHMRNELWHEAGTIRNDYRLTAEEILTRAGSADGFVPGLSSSTKLRLVAACEELFTAFSGQFHVKIEQVNRRVVNALLAASQHNKLSNWNPDDLVYPLAKLGEVEYHDCHLTMIERDVLPLISFRQGPIDHINLLCEWLDFNEPLMNDLMSQAIRYSNAFLLEASAQHLVERLLEAPGFHALKGARRFLTRSCQRIIAQAHEWPASDVPPHIRSRVCFLSLKDVVITVWQDHELGFKRRLVS